MWPIIFCTTVFVLMVAVVVRIRLRAARLEPIRARARIEPVTFSCFVRARMSDGHGFVDMKTFGGGILLRVHPSVLEVVMAGMEWAGRSMGSEVLLETKTSRMHRVKLGWAGTALGARPGILITGQDPGGRIQVAIHPGTHLEEAWEALVLAGVTPDTR
jgi:hypothetical protein